MREGEHGQLILETVGEHVTAEAALRHCAEILDETGDTSGAHVTRLIEGGVMLRRKEAASKTGVETPRYDDTTSFSTTLHDHWVGTEVLAALGIAQLDTTDPALAEAAAAAIREYEIKKLTNMMNDPSQPSE